MSTELDRQSPNHESASNALSQYMSFNLGTAVQCLWHVDRVGNPFDKMEEAIGYIVDEIARRRNPRHNVTCSECLTILSREPRPEETAAECLFCRAGWGPNGLGDWKRL